MTYAGDSVVSFYSFGGMGMAIFGAIIISIILLALNSRFFDFVYKRFKLVLDFIGYVCIGFLSLLGLVVLYYVCDAIGQTTKGINGDVWAILIGGTIGLASLGYVSDELIGRIIKRLEDAGAFEGLKENNEDKEKEKQ